MHLEIVDPKFPTGRAMPCSRSALDRLASLSRVQETNGSLRAWILDCGSGVIAYAAAMQLLKVCSTFTDSVGLRVFATDRHQSNLAIARRGSFLRKAFAFCEGELLRAYCRDADGQLFFSNALRETLVFSVVDILRDPAFTQLDFIYAPGVMQGLDLSSRTYILAKLHKALNVGGVLHLGEDAAEVDSTLFGMLEGVDGEYYAISPSSPPNARLRSASFSGAALSYVGSAASKLFPSSFLKNTNGAILHRELAERCAPSSVLIDHNFQVIHISDGAASFLRYPGGEPNGNIISLVRAPLQTDLRAVLFKAAATLGAVDVRHYGYAMEDWIVNVNMTVYPVAYKEEDYFVVTFDPVSTSVDNRDGTGSADVINLELAQHNEQLEADLKNLIIEANAAMRDMESAREALESRNEELRSMVDEFGASKEALRSLNSEHISRNEALLNQINRMVRANEKITNLLTTSQIAIIALDVDFVLCSYTPHAASIFNLLPDDIGRALFDIKHHLDWPTYELDLTSVIATGTLFEQEINHVGGQRYIVRFKQETTLHGSPDGWVLSFTDLISGTASGPHRDRYPY